MCYWQTAGHCLYVPKNKGIEDKDIQQSSHGHISVAANIGIEYKQPDFRVLAQHPEHTVSMLPALWSLLRLSVAASDFIFWGSAFVNSFCFFCYLALLSLAFPFAWWSESWLEAKIPSCKLWPPTKAYLGRVIFTGKGEYTESTRKEKTAVKMWIGNQAQTKSKRTITKPLQDFG